MASLTVDVRMDLDGLARRYRSFGRSVLRRVEARALNRTARQAEIQAARAIAKASGMPVRVARRGLSVERASKTRLRVALNAQGRAQNLIRFQARQTRRGVSARAWGVRKVYKGTFIANKGRTVFKRVGRKRLPIEPVWGPSIPQTWRRERLPRILERVFRERVSKVFHRELEFELTRRRQR